MNNCNTIHELRICTADFLLPTIKVSGRDSRQSTPHSKDPVPFEAYRLMRPVGDHRSVIGPRDIPGINPSTHIHSINVIELQP